MRHTIKNQLSIVFPPILCFATILLVFAARTLRPGWKDWIDTIVLPVFVGMLSTYGALVMGLKPFEIFLENIRKRRDLGSVADFWDSSADSQRFFVFFGGRYSESTVDPELRTTYATAQAFIAISEALERLYGKALRLEIGPARGREREIEKYIRSDNVILLGGDISLPITSQILHNIRARWYQQCLSESGEPLEHMQREIISRFHSARFSSSFVEQDKTLKSDIALVTRIVNPSTSNLLVLVSGNFGVGTAAAAIAITSKDLLDQTKFDAKEPAQQCVIRVVSGIRSGNVLSRQELRISVSHPWESFPYLDPISKVDDK